MLTVSNAEKELRIRVGAIHGFSNKEVIGILKIVFC